MIEKSMISGQSKSSQFVADVSGMRWRLRSPLRFVACYRNSTTRTVADMQDIEAQFNTRFLRFLLPLLLPLAIIIVGIRYVVEQQDSRVLITGSLTILGLLIAYVLSRAHYERLATWLIVGSINTSIIYSLFASANVDDVMVYASVGSLIAIVLLRPIPAGLVVVANLIITIMTRTILRPSSSPEAIDLIVFQFTISFLFFLVIFLRRVDQLQLIRSEQQYRNILEQAADIILTTDPQGYISYVNPAVESVTGLDIAYFIGKHVTELVASTNISLKMPPTDQLTNNTDDQLQEFPIITQSGEQRWVEQQLRPISISDKPIGFQGILRDVTHRKLAEQQQLQLVSERAHIELLKQSISDASHDLRTPLTAMKTTLMLLGQDSDSPPQKRIKRLEDETNKLTRIVDELLYIARLDESHDFSIQRLNVPNVVKNIVASLMPAAEAKHLSLIYESASSDTHILINETQFERVTSNLIINAINYTSRGAISVFVDTHDNQVVITVNDTGMGISEDHLPHIFERFYRTDEARKTVEESSGLGLAIVKKIVELHLGQIEVESVINEGSTFRVSLPIISG